jgi:undecaprenyl-diphosphatase
VLSDRRRAGGRRRGPVFLLGGAAVAGVGLLGVALGSAASFLGLTAFAAVVYVGLNAVTTVHRAMIPESFPESARSGATGAQEVAALIGGVVGVGAGGALLQVGHWAPFALTAAALPALTVPTVRVMRGRETFAAAPAGRERARLSDLAREAARPGVRSLLAAQALWVLGYAALPAFFILYAGHVLGIGPGPAGLWLVLFGALTGITMALAGRAREPRHHRRLVAAGVVLLGGGLLAAGAASTVPATAPGLAAAAAGFGLVTTIGFPLYSALIPPSETGRYTALYFAVRSVAGAIALPAAGWTVAATGSYRSILVAGGLVTLLALVPLGWRPGAPAWYRRAGAAWLAGWAAALVALAAAALGAGLLVARTPLAGLDAALFRAVNGLGHGPGALWTWLNPHTRNYIALIVLTAVLAALVDRRRAVAATGFVALSWVVALGLQEAVHLVWARPRPEEVLGAGEVVLDGHAWSHLASFPSGHAVATAALVAAMARAVPAARLPLWTYLAAVAVTRVLFGAHFPSDVIAGVALGYAAARAVEALLRRAALLELPLSGPARRRVRPEAAGEAADHLRREPSHAGPERRAHGDVEPEVDAQVHPGQRHDAGEREEGTAEPRAEHADRDGRREGHRRMRRGKGGGARRRDQRVDRRVGDGGAAAVDQILEERRRDRGDREREPAGGRRDGKAPRPQVRDRAGAEDREALHPPRRGEDEEGGEGRPAHAPHLVRRQPIEPEQRVEDGPHRSGAGVAHAASRRASARRTPSESATRRYELGRPS